MFWIGLLLFAGVGFELGLVLEGATGLGDASGVAPFVIGVNLVPWTGVLAGGALWAGSEKRRGVAAGPKSPALARVESARATGDGPNHTVKLDLTVAPKGVAPYRVHTTARVNVMDLDGYKAGRTLDVSYDPQRPWKVEVAALAENAPQVPLDGAPESTRASEPPTARRRGVLPAAAIALLLGFGLYFSLYWGS
ncbi:hypothetical protein AB0K51_18215 [Kitasatospora sp. NPDC049285]|uniref:hypothetical protein n=1 Tax=Kitasatospora sp. NPDC049285 TaxID=3157096 RepID=UPI003437C968